MSRKGPERRVEIKICGVTRIADAELAVDLGADYIGLNFHPGSPRFLRPESARRIADAVRGRTRIVGVVVDPSVEEVRQLIDKVGLDLIQFHGDEDPSLVAPFADRAIRAFRWRDDDPAPDLTAWRDVRAWLFDYRESDAYGGTGRSWSYGRLASVAAERPIFVAGGIRPDNVRSALEASGVAAVDICSGVEAAAGIKDPGLLHRLFEEVQDEKQ